MLRLKLQVLIEIYTSGLYGGAVANPINDWLTQMIASLHDENNHITIPGFYDQVDELTVEERARNGRGTV